MRATAMGLVAALATVVLVAGCGDDSGEEIVDGVPATESPSSAPDRSGCPDELARPDGVAAQTPARATPDLPDATEAVLCRYDLTDGGAIDGTWSLAGEPTALEGAGLRRVERALAELEPAPQKTTCTEELGPRFLVLLDDRSSQVGVVVDGFGCSTVRLTDDPAGEAPGEGSGDVAVPGLLQGPVDLVPLLERLSA